MQGRADARLQPKEVKDIKKFLEIARRKDATGRSHRAAARADAGSCAHQEDAEANARCSVDHQVQDPLLPTPVHLDCQGRRESRQASPSYAAESVEGARPG